MQTNQLFKALLVTFSTLFSGATTAVFAQTPTPQQIVDSTINEYIATNSAYAVAEMERTGIPASITLAQGICESRFGTSNVAMKAHNHFGIKCYASWKGKRYFHKDDEYKNGKLVPSCFRYYKTTEDSYRDHSDFLIGRPWYEHLFKLQSDDYKGWATGLRKAGYAHALDYDERLFKYINKFELYKFDKKGYKLDRKKLKIDNVAPEDSVQLVEEIAIQDSVTKQNATVFSPKSPDDSTRTIADNHNKIPPVIVGEKTPISTPVIENIKPTKKDTEILKIIEKTPPKLPKPAVKDSVITAKTPAKTTPKENTKPAKTGLVLLGQRKSETKEQAKSPKLPVPSNQKEETPTEKPKNTPVKDSKDTPKLKPKTPVFVAPTAVKDTFESQNAIQTNNGNKIKQHKVAIGDTPYKIARIYNISLEKLYELNKLPSGAAIAAGQILVVSE